MIYLYSAPEDGNYSIRHQLNSGLPAIKSDKNYSKLPANKLEVDIIGKARIRRKRKSDNQERFFFENSQPITATFELQ
jgi:hypothetical protein